MRLRLKYLFIIGLILPALRSYCQKDDCETIYMCGDSTIIQPQYENGALAFRRFCEEVASPIPIVCGMIPGKARVIVEFGVDKQGNVFDPRILRMGRIYCDLEFDKIYEVRDKNWKKDIDFEYCKEEAFRILRLAKFIPAQRDSVPVCYGDMRTLIDVYYAAPGYD